MSPEARAAGHARLAGEVDLTDLPDRGPLRVVHTAAATRVLGPDLNRDRGPDLGGGIRARLAGVVAVTGLVPLVGILPFRFWLFILFYFILFIKI